MQECRPGGVLRRSARDARARLSLCVLALFLAACGGGGNGASTLLAGQPSAAICNGANSLGASQAVYVAAQGIDVASESVEVVSHLIGKGNGRYLPAESQ